MKIYSSMQDYSLINVNNKINIENIIDLLKSSSFRNNYNYIPIYMYIKIKFFNIDHLKYMYKQDTYCVLSTIDLSSSNPPSCISLTIKYNWFILFLCITLHCNKTANENQSLIWYKSSNREYIPGLFDM